MQICHSETSASVMPFSFNHIFPSRFDLSHPDLFTPSSRSRIIEFILKRKRLSDDNDDEFDFGVERALAEGVYIAAYPLHDVS